MKGRLSRTLTIFYIICGYVLLQFGWWAYQLIQLNREIIHINWEQGDTHPEKQIFNKTFMVAGEGVVFLLLILIGAIYILRSFRREIQLARRQQNFLLSITHELKTPISTIKLYLQTLLKRDLDEAKKKEAVDTMLRENERLNSLVSKMLLAAKMDDSNFKLSKEKVNLSTLVVELVQGQSYENATIETDIAEGISVSIDTESIDTVLTNLIDNAVKYGSSKVVVSLKQTDNQTTLAVTDNGQGIVEAERVKIFQRFYRAGNEDTRKTKGTGLGLYIVKTLVEMHGGVISVSNNSPKGSIFTIQFNAE
ncbi:MAG: HAMP domain-containing histidine kinase [Flavobacteriales bacterium]|nr:HAMP domain-containing histidine kinase [Flavobacteriales bacterium]